MNSLLYFAALGVGLFHLGQVAHSTESKLPLKRAVDAAWAKSVESRESAASHLRASAAREVASSFTPAPAALEFSVLTDRWHGATGERETEFGVSLPLWHWGQRAGVANAAASEQVLAKASEDALRLRIAGEVREAAWQLVGADLDRTRAIGQEQTFKQLMSDIERRVRAGDLARADLLAAQAEWLEADAAVTIAGDAYDSAMQRWTLLTGLVVLPDASERQHEVGAVTHPDALRASAEADLAARRVDVARAARRDPLELALSTRDERPGAGELARRSVVLALRIPLGSASRAAPIIANALAERDVLQARAALEQERLNLQLALTKSQLEAAARRAASADQRALALRERSRLIDLSFKAGESPLPELLRALTLASQAEAAGMRAEIELGLARARLNQSLGVLP